MAQSLRARDNAQHGSPSEDGAVGLVPRRLFLKSLYNALCKYMSQQDVSSLRDASVHFCCSPTVLAYTSTRLKLIKKYDQATFHAMREAVVKFMQEEGGPPQIAPPEAPPGGFVPLVPTPEENKLKIDEDDDDEFLVLEAKSAGKKNLVARKMDEDLLKLISDIDAEKAKANCAEWLNLFINDGSAGQTSTAASTRVAPGINKISLTLPHYRGVCGSCLAWWREARTTLESVFPNANAQTRATWVPTVLASIKNDDAKSEFRRLCGVNTTNGVVDFDATILAFINTYDQHSLDRLYKRFSFLKQASSESIVAFHTKFWTLCRDLAEQGLPLSDTHKWVAFRNKICREQEIRKREEIDNVDSAIDYLKRTSSANIKLTPTGGVAAMLPDRGGDRLPDDVFQKEMKRRCKKCKRLIDLHKRQGKRFNNGCPFPSSTLARQLQWENRNKRKRRDQAASSRQKKYLRGIVSQMITEQQTTKAGKQAKTGRAPADDEEATSSRSTKRRVVKQGDAIDASELQSDDFNVVDLCNAGNPTPTPIESSVLQAICEDDSDEEELARSLGVEFVNKRVTFENDEAEDLQVTASDTGRSVARLIDVSSDDALRANACNVERRRISMSYLQLERANGLWLRTAALFDTGAEPDSYISLRMVQRLGLRKRVRQDPVEHRTAQKGARFSSIGDLRMRIRLPNGEQVLCKLRVADISTELIIGAALMRALGAVIDMTKGQIVLKRADHCVLRMIRRADWRAVSFLTADDFLSGAKPLPDLFKRKFPGKNLREIAQTLESIPPEHDLSVAEGCRIIKQLLASDYKCVVEPRGSPSDRIPPVRIPFRKQCEGCVVNIPERTRPSSEWDKIESQVDSWLKSGKVEKSTSPFNTPHVVAPKATPPFFRLAQDFRRLNKLIEPMKHPLRRIDELVEELSRKRYKSTLDQDQAYTQIPIHREDRKKTAFSTRNGKYHFVTCPYGLVISGDLFCSVKNKCYSENEGHLLLWRYIWSYVDDDAIGSNTVLSHLFVLVCIFERLKAYGLTLREEKCQFLKETVKYGGYIVGHNIVTANPKKLVAIEAIKPPTTRKELGSFLGMASWIFKKFYPPFAEFSSQLTTRIPKGKRQRSQFFSNLERGKTGCPF